METSHRFARRWVTVVLAGIMLGTVLAAVPLATPPSSALPAGSSAFLLGDSIFYGSQSLLVSAAAGWQLTIDAQGGRALPAGLPILAARRSEIGRVAVIHLCTNRWGSAPFVRYYDDAMRTLAGVEQVYWVTCTEWAPAIPEANAVIRQGPSRYANARVIE